MALLGEGRDGDSSKQFVGRAAELARLTDALSRARAGASGAVALVGEPGIGKSRLLRELWMQAEAAGFDVVVGRGFELEREVPFGMVVDALDRRVEELGAARLGELGIELAELGAVLPSLGRVAGGLHDTLDAERYRAHRAVRDVLAQLARQRPLLLAFDDVHWADPASIELVAHLLRHLVPRTLLMLAFRPQQAPLRLAGAIELMRHEGEPAVIELAPLSLTEAGALFGERAGAGLQALYDDSGGNPFYLEQLARDRAPAALSDYPTALGDTVVPVAVRESIARELNGLSANARRLLEAAAVAGDPVDLDLAGGIAELDEHGTLEAIGRVDRRRPVAYHGRVGADAVPASDRPSCRL